MNLKYDKINMLKQYKEKINEVPKWLSVLQSILNYFILVFVSLAFISYVIFR
jgi:hypothetical protein